MRIRSSLNNSVQAGSPVPLTAVLPVKGRVQLGSLAGSSDSLKVYQQPLREKLARPGQTGALPIRRSLGRSGPFHPNPLGVWGGLTEQGA